MNIEHDITLAGSFEIDAVRGERRRILEAL